MNRGPTRESNANRSNLELGDTRDNKRALTIVLSVIHLFSFVGIITLLAASTQFSWTRGLVAVLAVVIWLFSFILLFVNAMSYFFAREKRQQARAREVTEETSEETSAKASGETFGEKPARSPGASSDGSQNSEPSS
ncbi:MAG: hypothetical protein U5L04_05510 [Trueperaceae bacterium]|nr:hypothetical protein [Trueperaceae bacterium]